MDGDARRSSPIRLIYPAALAAILLLAVSLRFYRLDASSLWSDEGNTWAMLSRSFGEIAGAAAADIHPPLYYWLLKLWSSLLGTSAWAMRSFSAAAGLLLVLAVERIAHRIAQGIAAPASAVAWLPLLAALAAATNPLLIYYSQEARMYMLLALAGAGLMWALMSYLPETSAQEQLPSQGGAAALAYVLFAALGLWTHYSFAILLAAANLAWFAWWLRLRAARSPAVTWHPLARWIALNLLALLLYLPWLPTAIQSVLNWPGGGVTVTLSAGLELVLTTLLFGPVRTAPQPAWLWLFAGAVLPLLGLVGLAVVPLSYRRPGMQAAPAPRGPDVALIIALWLGLPIVLMAVLGLFTDAFLKFLITASPAWCLLVACVPLLVHRPLVRAVLAGGVAVFTLLLAAVVLPPYYQDAAARDNYQGVAAWLAATGDPQHDLVILDAPGQQEVWRYYDPGLPVLALPSTRPPVATEVEAELAQATAGRRNLYALFWATDEADPQRLVESWLDRSAFKALDTWQGNLRLATYALPTTLQPVPMQPVQLGAAIELAGQAQPADPQHVTAGEAVLVQLHWRVGQDVTQRFKVSVQLLDAANQVVAQRDSEPVGGSSPTDTWRAGDEILDNYALPVPLGTPPGVYKLVATVYDAQTGERLQHADGDLVELGSVWVDHSPLPAPAALIPMAHRLRQSLGSVTLLGYDLYHKDFAHAPATPLQPGDTAHFVFYWQAPVSLPPDWPADSTVTLRLGDHAVTAPLGGGAHPTARWQAGEIVRLQLDIPYDGSNTRPILEVAGQTVRLAGLSVQ